MKNNAIVLLAILLLPALAFACAGGSNQLIFRMSGTTNAHAELWNGAGSYPTEICYDDAAIFGIPYPGASPHTGNTILKASATTNAHVEESTQANYATLIQYGDLVCAYRAACIGSERCVATMSAVTNAHVATCTGPAPYAIKVCCGSAPAANNPPVANAGVDQSVPSGVSVSLAGLCTDSDGVVSDCDWGAAPAGCVYDFAEVKSGLGAANAGSNVDVTCVGAVGSVFAFALTATDDGGATGSDSMNVTIAITAGEPFFRIIRFDAVPLSFPAPAGPGSNDFDSIGVKVRNLGSSAAVASVEVGVFDTQTDDPIALVVYPLFFASGNVDAGLDRLFNGVGVDISSLPSGAYKLTAIVKDSGGAVHDRKSTFFTVGTPVPVPELDVFLLPLIALSVLAVLFFFRKKGKI